MKRALRVVCLLSLGSFGGACAVVFPEYDLESTGAGGAGGAPAEGGGGTTTSSPTLSPDGAACTDGFECASGQCVPSSSRDGSVCCAQACFDEGASQCGTTGTCDPDGAACAVYPDGTACGDLTVCQDAFLTTLQCVEGACTPVVDVCPNGLECEPPPTPMGSSTACKDQCLSNADCAVGTCIQSLHICQKPTGEVCFDDNECLSGACGVPGGDPGGHCCAQGVTCAVGGTCGAVDCDALGQCEYPSETTVCSVDQSCDGFLLAGFFCDGAGSCETVAEEHPCPEHYVCDAMDECLDACLTNDAAGDALCAPGFWCTGEACVGRLPPLSECQRGSQCISGACLPFFGVLVCTF